MSKWTHHLCDACWRQRNPNRQATRIVNHTGKCCGCGGPATGIYVRATPDSMQCNGQGPEHADEIEQTDCSHSIITIDRATGDETCEDCGAVNGKPRE